MPKRTAYQTKLITKIRVLFGRYSFYDMNKSGVIKLKWWYKTNTEPMIEFCDLHNLEYHFSVQHSRWKGAFSMRILPAPGQDPERNKLFGNSFVIPVRRKK